jgi:hypothetical protein
MRTTRSTAAAQGRHDEGFCAAQHRASWRARRAPAKGGTTPALAVVINATVDALAELGVRHIEMPATPERVWRAIREATAQE